MAWTYANWRSAGAIGSSARISALQSHIAEVAAQVSAEVSTHGHSRSTTALNDYLRRLEEAEVAEQNAARNMTNAGLGRVRLGKPV